MEGIGSKERVVFNIGDQAFGIDILEIQAIENFIGLETAKNPPKNILGTLILRGTTVPVYSLRKRFGMEEKPGDEDTKILVMASENILVAYKVDRMNEIIEVLAEDRFEAPLLLKTSKTAYIDEVIRQEGRLVIHVDINEIIVDEEQKEIEEFLENVIEEKRLAVEKKKADQKTQREEVLRQKKEEIARKKRILADRQLAEQNKEKEEDEKRKKQKPNLEDNEVYIEKPLEETQAVVEKDLEFKVEVPEENQVEEEIKEKIEEKIEEKKKIDPRPNRKKMDVNRERKKTKNKNRPTNKPNKKK